MNKSSAIGISASFVLYFVVSVGGYAALGNDAPGYVFAAFPTAPKWLMLIGNILVLLHMYGAYMVYGQPVFDTIESYLKVYILKWTGALPKDHEASGSDASDEGKAAVGKTIDDEHVEPPSLVRESAIAKGVDTLHRLSRVSQAPNLTTGFANTTVPSNEEYGLPIYQRFLVRAPYVVFTTVIACCLPFFADMAGLVGAVSFWPLSIFFPAHCFRKVYKPTGWKSYALWTIEIGMFFVAVGSIIGAIRGIVVASKNYKVFGD